MVEYIVDSGCASLAAPASLAFAALWRCGYAAVRRYQSTAWREREENWRVEAASRVVSDAHAVAALIGAAHCLLWDDSGRRALSSSHEALFGNSPACVRDRIVSLCANRRLIGRSQTPRTSLCHRRLPRSRLAALPSAPRAQQRPALPCLALPCSHAVHSTISRRKPSETP